MPGVASGKTWLKIACILDAPNAIAPSLIVSGTANKEALVTITIVGRDINAKTNPPTIGDDLGK